MIITENIEIKVTRRNINNITKKGYICNLGDIIEIKTEHLSKGSHKIIQAKCDFCEVDKSMKYKSYLKYIEYDGLYYCSSCSLVKRKEVCMNKYGFENYFESEEFKQKSKKSCLIKYGQEFYQKTSEYKNRIIQTCQNKYGVNNIMQIYNLHDKQQKSAYYSNFYKNTNLNYRGTYELHFLDKYHNSLNIENGPTVPYLLNENNHVYHSDFYLPDYNLIVEIKSKYTYEYDLDKNIVKKEQCLNDGYNFLFIIDKNYENLNDILNI